MRGCSFLAHPGLTPWLGFSVDGLSLPLALTALLTWIAIFSSNESVERLYYSIARKCWGCRWFLAQNFAVVLYGWN